MKKYIATLIAGIALVGACKDSTGVPDFNNPSLQGILGAPLTRLTLQNLVTGYIDAQRASLGVAPATGILFAEIMARDAYRTDASEARYVNEFLNGTPDPGAFSGSSNWTTFYRDIRAANTIQAALPSAPATELTAVEAKAVLGLVQTMKAIDYYKALEYRDTVGVALDVDHPLGEPLAPLVCKPKVLAFVSALLDSGYANLQAGGAAFPVTLPAGFAPYNTPATYALFNRGWKGKVELYRALDHQSPTGAAGFQAAITAINQSYINTSDPALIGQGVYFTFSTAPGDTPNQLVDANLHANPKLKAAVDTTDRRYVTKVVELPTASTIQGVTYKQNFRVTQLTPIAYLKNEELILLRAQAKVGLGDLAGALADVNFVRTASGGVAPLPAFANATAAIDAILYEKRLSLLMESAHRLVDLRAYGRLQAPFLTKELPGDIFLKALPIPQNEADQRGGNLTVSCS